MSGMPISVFTFEKQQLGFSYELLALEVKGHSNLMPHECDILVS